MRLIRQRNDIDCGIAVAAMAAGVPYRNAARADRNPGRDIGLSTGELVAMMRDLGVEARSSTAGYGEVFKSAAWPAGAVAVLIRPNNRRRGHFVAVSGGDVFDPDHGRFPLAKYPLRGWSVIRWFVK